MGVAPHISSPKDQKPINAAGYPVGFGPRTTENPLGLPPDWVYLQGERMPLARFLQLHAADLAAFPDAQIAVLQEEYHPSEVTKDVVKGVVTATSGLLAGLVSKNPATGRWVGAVAGNVLAGSVVRKLDRPRQVVIIRVRDLFGTD